MTSDDFVRRYKHSLASDVSLDGQSTAFAPGHPAYLGQEHGQYKLGGLGWHRNLCLTTDGQLLAASCNQSSSLSSP